MGIADEVRAQRTGVRVSAQRTFTNRVAECAAFDEKIRQLREFRRNKPDWPNDLTCPRQNVLVFYGHGGIGKTRLSTELERALADATENRASSVRIDFANPASRDPEVLLLSIRAGLARSLRSLPAFDTALAVYWARRHPGTSVVEFVTAQPAIGGAADRQLLAQNLKEFFVDALDGGGLLVGSARRATGIALDSLRRWKEFRRLERDCPYFTACIEEPDIEELRLHLPLLLAWDLAQAERGQVTDFVVFLDTFEHVSEQWASARRGGLEDTTARCAFFLAGVTFVVTTRTRLDWGSPDHHQLEYSGPQTWSGLTADVDESDQHHVGALSTEDCLLHLTTCLLDEKGEPAIPPDLRTRIAELSGGVPLYLDVAVSHYVELRAAGVDPDATDFARGIPQIVLRLMDDLSAIEADLFRCASLLGVFDQETLRAACPTARASAVNRFIERTLVTPRNEGIYALHELLIESVRLEDQATADPWSEEDWDQAESRVLTYWTRRFADGIDNLWQDRRMQTLAFWQLASLYATTNVEAEAIAEITMQVQLRGAWSTISAARAQPPELLTPRGHAFMDVLDGLMARQVGHLATADELLDRAIASGSLGPSVARLAAYYLGETRDVHIGSADPIFLSLQQGDDRFANEATLAYAHSLVRRSDLLGALDHSALVVANGGDPEFTYRSEELEGTIWLFAGEFQRAADHFERSRLVATNNESPLLDALALRHLALSLCWLEPGAALVVLDRAEQLNRDLSLPPGVGQCLVARAIASSQTATRRELDDLLEESERAFEDAGYLDDAVAALAAAVFVAAARNERDRAERVHQRLMTAAIDRRPRTWLAAADIWMGNMQSVGTVSWPLGQDRAVHAWSEPLLRRSNPSPPPGE